MSIFSSKLPRRFHVDRREFLVGLSKGAFVISSLDISYLFLSPNLLAADGIKVSDIIGQSVAPSRLTAQQIIAGIPTGQDYLDAAPIDEGSHQHEVRIGRTELAAIRESFRGSGQRVSLQSQDGYNASGRRVQGPHQVTYDLRSGLVRGTEISVPLDKLTGSDPISLTDPTATGTTTQTGSQTSNPTGSTTTINQSPLAIGAKLSDAQSPDLFVEATAGSFTQAPEYCVEAPGVLCVWKPMEPLSFQGRNLYRARALQLVNGAVIKVRSGTQLAVLDVLQL